MTKTERISSIGELTPQMIVRLKQKNTHYPDLTTGKQYAVIGIEADDLRVLNDRGYPYLYPETLFDIADSREPEAWITEFGDDGERYSYPPTLNSCGFFEDFFDGKKNAVKKFWQVVNQRLISGMLKAS